MKKMNSKHFDEAFDDNKDISDHIDWDSGTRINEAPMRVSVDFPKWMVASLDKKAHHFGISRQALIKLSVANNLNAPPSIS